MGLAYTEPMEEAVRLRFERIEAILEQVAERQTAAETRAVAYEARVNTRMDRADARMDRAEARMDRAEARMDKRMRGFEKLVQIGMKELSALRRLHRESEVKINALVDAQQRTEASLRAFIESLRRGGNGHGAHNR
jgi:phage-related tail protein